MKAPVIRSVLDRALAAVQRSSLLVPRGRARTVSLALGGVILAGASTQVAIAWSSALPKNAVFRAGETVVTEGDLQQRIDILEALYGLKVPQKGPKLERFNRDAAKSLAVSLIVDRAAKDHGIVISEKGAHDALTSLIEDRLPGGRDSFVQFLATREITERDVLNEVRRQIATTRLFAQTTSDVPQVTNAVVRQAYQDRKKEMIIPEKRHLRNIVVQSKNDANQLMARIRTGAEFAALAKRYSIDRSTRYQGGDIGTLYAEQLDRRYADAAFRTDRGNFFGPVKTQHGWNIGQVLSITPAKQLDFDRVKQQLAVDLYNKRKYVAWRSWLSNQIRNADIEYADGYRPGSPDAPPTGTLFR